MLASGAFVTLLMGPPLARSMAVTLARFLEPAGLLSDESVRWEAVWQMLGMVAAALVAPILLFVAAALGGLAAADGLRARHREGRLRSRAALAARRISVASSRCAPPLSS